MMGTEAIDRVGFVGCESGGGRMVKVGIPAETPDVLRVADCPFCHGEHMTPQPLARARRPGEQVDVMLPPPPHVPSMADRIVEALSAADDRTPGELAVELEADPRTIRKRVEALAAEERIIVHRTPSGHRIMGLRLAADG
jgi:hypothetical protein